MSKRPETRQEGEGDPTFEIARVALDPSSRPFVSLLWEGGAATIPLPNRDPIVIGRGADADIVIESRSISRRHARLHSSGSFEIEDLGSANGTSVGGRTLKAGERAPVDFHKPVTIGSAILVLRPGPLLGSQALAGTSAAPNARGESTGEYRSKASPIEEVDQLVTLVAPTDMSVLLLGETGAGKGYFARLIHDRSRRKDGPFVHLNCAALPENLFESELFGHERGAFSGATQAKAGLLESAARGTVFLDEVGDLPAPVQAKLLVAIERREVLRVGALKTRPIDVRFVSATNKTPDARGIVGFRPDLYFRIAGLPIQIPPLRERVSDIPVLAAVFLAEGAKRMGRAPPALSAAAAEVLRAHPWHGNVRELASVMERALLFCGDTLLEEHLHLGPRDRSINGPSSAPSRAHPDGEGRPRPLAEEVEEVERRGIIQALEACGGHQSRAAEMLGISRRTLITRMIAFGLPRPRKG